MKKYNKIVLLIHESNHFYQLICHYSTRSVNRLVVARACNRLLAPRSPLSTGGADVKTDVKTDDKCGWKNPATEQTRLLVFDLSLHLNSPLHFSPTSDRLAPLCR